MKDEHQAKERQKELYQFGLDLAKGSDYLTSEIRSYVQFGDRTHFDNFWLEVKVTKSRDKALSRLKELGISQEDLNILQKEKNYSDNLIQVEDDAMDGESALEILEEEKPDLILLDIVMPGIDGFETCRRIKNNPNLKDIPVIFISGKTESEDVSKGISVGGVDYIPKPFKAEEIYARIKAHLEP
jgi:CheY-like chemotaxis protein